MVGRLVRLAKAVFKRAHSQQSDTSPFLALPAELRNSIYKRIFTSEESLLSALSDERASAGLGLLLTCRRIYQEASLVAFSSTVFVVRGRCGPRISPQLSVLKPHRFRA